MVPFQKSLDLTGLTTEQKEEHIKKFILEIMLKSNELLEILNKDNPPLLINVLAFCLARCGHFAGYSLEELQDCVRWGFTVSQEQGMTPTPINERS